MGWQPQAARNPALRFRQHTIEQIEQMLRHLGDEQRLIALSKQGRQQLEQVWAQEREPPQAQAHREGWIADPAVYPGDARPPPPLSSKRGSRARTDGAWRATSNA